ncbi:MFS transporter [Paraburkholderia caffeinilytica]|uniref:MFS transporter n=1 Tax=Paraburkholderia caffeinilytica TaxID=1761016 RepID=UPI0038BCA8CF
MDMGGSTTEAYGLPDERKPSRFQIIALALCGLCVVMDGFDVQVIGYVAPTIIRDWGMAKADIGVVFSAGLLGLVMGSFGLSMLADRIGRRPLLIATMSLLGVFSILTGLANSLPELMLFRLLSGLTLGSILPNAMALAGEYSPPRHRISAMMMVSVGFTVGAVLAGFLCALLMPKFGWRSVFFVGGIIPLVSVVPMVRHLPESIQFLLARNRLAAADKWLERTGQPTPDHDATAAQQPFEAKRTIPIASLFSDGRGFTTLRLWIATGLNLVAVAFLSNWVPTLVLDLHATQSTAILAGTVLQTGGALGALVMGRLIDRRGFRAILGPAFVLSAICLASFGIHGARLSILLMAIFVVGFCIVGGQSGLNAMAAAYYPPYARATGIGWCVGVGRLASVFAPLLTAMAIRDGLTSGTIFMLGGVVPLLCAVIMASLRISSSSISY